jgi:hypothetical protein
MSNNLSSNYARKLIPVFLERMEAKRELSKAVNTQLFQGKINPSSGSEIDVKRPHQYRAVETPDGNMTAATKNAIIAGKATATVQNYITVEIDLTNKQEALELNQLEEIVDPAVDETITRLETNFASFMVRNSGLAYGSPGTVVDSWSDVAGAGALAHSVGWPGSDWYYAMNPFTQVNLANAQNGLGAVDSLVKTSWERAQINRNFAGMKPIACTTLASYTSGTASDRVGALAANPNVTYVGAKDTMTQTLSCSGFSANGTFRAGEVIQITGRFRCNIATRQPIFDAAGAQVLWRAVITADATADGAGAVTLTVTGPAIFEANGQYNTTTAAIVSGDIVTVLGSASTAYQPNMFFHRDAFTIATVKLPKLFSTDTIGTTRDGISVRMSQYSDGRANTNSMRVDLLPAFGAMNPFLAGHGYGV